MKWKNKIVEAEFSFYNAPITNIVPSKKVTILDIVTLIRSDEDLKSKTNHLRFLLAKNEDADVYKRKAFPYVTFSGVFSKRTKDCLINHSNLICIDIDDLDRSLVEQVSKKVQEDLDHTVMSFVSPSGRGLKIIYAIDTAKNSHDTCFNSVIKYLNDYLDMPEVKADLQCKEVVRACFLPNDETVFFNPRLIEDTEEDVIPIEVKTEEDFKTSYESPKSDADKNEVNFNRPIIDFNLNFEDIDSEENFTKLCRITESKMGPYQRPRKVWIHELAARCNLFGMTEEFCKNSVVKLFSKHPKSDDASDPLNFGEHFFTPVSSTYSTYKGQNGTWKKLEKKILKHHVSPRQFILTFLKSYQMGAAFSTTRGKKIFFFWGLSQC